MDVIENERRWFGANHAVWRQCRPGSGKAPQRQRKAEGDKVQSGRKKAEPGHAED